MTFLKWMAYLILFAVCWPLALVVAMVVIPWKLCTVGWKVSAWGLRTAGKPFVVEPPVRNDGVRYLPSGERIPPLPPRPQPTATRAS